MKKVSLALILLAVSLASSLAGDFTMPGERTRAGGRPAKVYLETINFTAATFVNTNVSWAGFSSVEFFLDNFTPSGSGILQLQYHSNGAYQASGYTSGNVYESLAATPAFTGNSATTFIYVMQTGWSAYTISGNWRIYNINSLSNAKVTEGNSDANVTTGGPTNWGIQFGGDWNGATPVDGAQLSISTGTMSGKLTIYGIP